MLHILTDITIPGSARFSLDQDEVSSVLGSRRSLADTSVTSTADLSVFSSATTAGGSASRASQHLEDECADDVGTTVPSSAQPPTRLRRPSNDSLGQHDSGRSTPKANLDHLHPTAIGKIIIFPVFSLVFWDFYLKYFNYNPFFKQHFLHFSLIKTK
jgi:hypothetical protein